MSLNHLHIEHDNAQKALIEREWLLYQGTAVVDPIIKSHWILIIISFCGGHMLILNKQQKLKNRFANQILGHVEFFMAPAHLAPFLSQQTCLFLLVHAVLGKEQRSWKSLLGQRSIPGALIVYRGTEQHASSDTNCRRNVPGEQRYFVRIFQK